MMEIEHDLKMEEGSPMKPTDFASKGLYKCTSNKRVRDINRIFNESIHNSQNYIVGNGKVQLDIGNLETYETSKYMHFDSNQLRGFLRKSSYGADNSESTVKKVQADTMMNRFADHKTTKNMSTPFRSIPRNQKGQMRTFLEEKIKEKAFHPLI